MVVMVPVEGGSQGWVVCQQSQASPSHPNGLHTSLPRESYDDKRVLRVFTANGIADRPAHRHNQV